MPLIETDVATVALSKNDKGNETVASDAYAEAIREGRAFSAGSGLRRIDARKVLNQKFVNPIGSGKNAFVVLRAFYNNAKSNEPSLQLRFIPSPVDMPGADRITPSNLKTGGISSVMEFWAEDSEVPLNRDPPVSNPTAFILPTGGQVFKIETPRLVEPGESFGFYMFGGADDVDFGSINYVWYEEDI